VAISGNMVDGGGIWFDLGGSGKKECWRELVDVEGEVESLLLVPEIKCEASAARREVAPDIVSERL
jgi:hypothetical protein